MSDRPRGRDAIRADAENCDDPTSYFTDDDFGAWARLAGDVPSLLDALDAADARAAAVRRDTLNSAIAAVQAATVGLPALSAAGGQQAVAALAALRDGE